MRAMLRRMEQDFQFPRGLTRQERVQDWTACVQSFNSLED